MAIAQDPKATFEYTLLCDRKLDSIDQTIFELRGLTVAEEATVADKLFAQTPGEEQMSLRMGSQQLEIVKLGIRGWSNLKRADGNLVEFKARNNGGQIQDALLDWISPYLSELANAISERGKVTEDEGN